MRNTEDGGTNPDYPGRQVERYIDQLEAKVDGLNEQLRKQSVTIAEYQGQVTALKHALFVSVRLQSHYATLLNGWDGGRRLTFANPEEWMKRLAETPEGMPVYEEH